MFPLSRLIENLKVSTLDLGFSLVVFLIFGYHIWSSSFLSGGRFYGFFFPSKFWQKKKPSIIFVQSWEKKSAWDIIMTFQVSFQPH